MADTALNPSHTIARILARPLQLYLGLKGDALDKRIAQLLDLVQLPQRVRQAPAGRTVGRPEAARQPGARAGGRTRPDPVRRSDFGARHRGRRGHPRPAGGIAQGTGRVLHVHQPRPEHRARGLRRHRGAVRRPEGRGHGAAPRSATRRAIPYFHLLATSVPELRPGWLDEVGAAQRAALAAGAGAGRPRRDLQLPGPLPAARGRRVRQQDAAAARARRRRRGVLPSQRRRTAGAAAGPEPRPEFVA